MKSVSIYTLLIIAMILAHLPCRAQESNYLFSSRVIAADSTAKSIRDCHIVNKTQRMATVSNAYGDFRIMANVNDSIQFSVLGYEKRVIVVTDSLLSYGHVIRLKPVAYELEEVTIKPLVLTPLITKWEVYIPPLPNQGGVNIPTGFSPVTFFYDRFSKEGKNKRYLQKVRSGTIDYMRIGEKFNGELVSRLTGLKDDELVTFMSTCNFSNDFLLNYSPETIKRAIMSKYREYMEKKGVKP